MMTHFVARWWGMKARKKTQTESNVSGTESMGKAKKMTGLVRLLVLGKKVYRGNRKHNGQRKLNQ